MGKKSRNKKQQQKQRAVSTSASSMPLAQATFSPTPTRVAGLELGEQFIRQDIRRILMLLTIVAVILIILVITNVRSSVLFGTGLRLASFMRLAS